MATAGVVLPVCSWLLFQTRRECGVLVCCQCQKANYLHLPTAPGHNHPVVPPASMAQPSLTPSVSQPPLFALRPSIPPSTASQQPTFQPWTRPDTGANSQASGSQVNQRRIIAAARHQQPSTQLPHSTAVAHFPLISLPTVQVPKRKNTRLSAVQRAVTGKQKVVDMKYFIVIHAQQLGHYVNNDYPGNYFTTLRIPPTSKLEEFLAQAQSLNLLIRHEKAGSIDSHIANDFDYAIDTHMREHNLAFVDLLSTPSPSPATRSSRTSQPAFVLDPEPKWHPLYIKASTRIQAADTFTPILYRQPKAVADITYADISTKSKMPIVHVNQEEWRIVIIVPNQNIVVGDFDGTGPHTCLPIRLWGRILDHPFEIECNDSCGQPQQETNISEDTSDRDMDIDTNHADPFAFDHVAATDHAAEAISTASSFDDNTPPPATTLTLEELEIREVQQGVTRLQNGMSATVIALWDIALSDIHNDAEQPDAYMVIRSPSIEAASEALIHHLKHLVIGTPIPEDLCPHTVVRNVTEAAMSHSYFQADINGAPGDGPRRQLWSHLMSTLLADWKHFVKMPEDNFYTPSLVPAPADFAHATTSDFVKAVAPQAAKRLASWPPKAIGPPNEDGTLPALALDSTMDPMSLIIELVPGVTADHIHDMSLQNQLELLPSINAGLLFAHQTQDVETSYLSHRHPIFEAVTLGINYPFFSEVEIVGESQPAKLIDIFRTNLDILTLLETMYKDRIVVNSMDLLPYITWADVEPRDDDPAEDLSEYFARQSRFLELLRHYLRGKGHPQGAVGVSPQEFWDSREDAALRPTLFLEAVTSSQFLPLAHLRIIIQFRRLLVPATAQASGANFHTCFRTVEFLVGDAFAALAQMSNPVTPPAAFAAFDVWMHSLLWGSNRYIMVVTSLGFASALALALAPFKPKFDTSTPYPSTSTVRSSSGRWSSSSQGVTSSIRPIGLGGYDCIGACTKAGTRVEAEAGCV
ncbi:hypothetical protein CVT25_004816 [Psilocybe cyanescens]|uniref:Uncharacterized protein n=1 Tax=Psilocybe cyanescens TaxID=93625 RepID=A0A409XGL8_PSICY|nr:hypothetical protein CVT25_004816 [Psilocybe cyanescens]